MNKRPQVVKHLSDSEYKMLTNVYAKHNSSMGLSERAKYNFSEIVKVKRNISENCLEVYYANGEWFKYFPNGTWG